MSALVFFYPVIFFRSYGSAAIDLFGWALPGVKVVSLGGVSFSLSGRIFLASYSLTAVCSSWDYFAIVL